MSEYVKTIEIMETDFFCQMPPSQVLAQCLDLTLRDITADGCGRDAIRAHCGACWMISHARFEQYAPIQADDTLTFRTYPRVEERSRFFYQVDIFRDGQLVIRFDTAYIPVDAAERRALRTAALAPLWRSPARIADAGSPRRLRPGCAFLPCGSDTVRFSDCDSNRHLTSKVYLSLICDALGFWECDAPRFMQRMQVDFASEVRPGTELRFEKGEADGVRYLRGRKGDGTVAFTAGCVF